MLINRREQRLTERNQETKKSVKAT